MVFGLFGLGLFVVYLGFGVSILAGSLTLGILNLPVIIRSTEEALLTVPKTYREASLSLGATRWQTIYKIVLPNALPGILTGVMLSLKGAARLPPHVHRRCILHADAAQFHLSEVMALPYHLRYGHSGSVIDRVAAYTVRYAIVLIMLSLLLNLAGLIARYSSGS